MFSSFIISHATYERRNAILIWNIFKKIYGSIFSLCNEI